MRVLLSIIGCIFVINATAQVVNKQQFIKLTYKPNGTYAEQAVETITAVNIILAKTTVDYRAGRSIELLPGFQAKQGALFTAHIGESTDSKLQLIAFPNPFDKSTTISFDLPEAGLVNLFVVNEKGQIVQYLLENSQQGAGKHDIEWQADAHSSGVYIPVLRTGQQQISSRVIKK